MSLVVSFAQLITFCLNLALLLLVDVACWHWSSYPHVLSYSLVLHIQRVQQKVIKQNTLQFVVSKTLLLFVIVRRVQFKNSSQLCCLSSRITSSESSKFGSLPHMKAALSYKRAASSWEEKVPKWICFFSTLMAACHFMFL